MDFQISLLRRQDATNKISVILDPSVLVIGRPDESKKALLAWETVCTPKTAGGFNVVQLRTWNRAAICKLLWCLSNKKDRLWVRWINAYYGKYMHDWAVPKQASWVVQKIIKARTYMLDTGLDVEEVLGWSSFSVKNMYVQMRGNFQKVHWKKLTCNNAGSPKWIFVLNLTAQNKLLTRDRSASWGITQDVICPLCNVENESANHLFFACAFSEGIWATILAWQGIRRNVLEWKDEVQYATTRASGNSVSACIYRMSIAASIYQIWAERNMRIFQSKSGNPDLIIRQVIREVVGRGTMRARLARKLEELNSYP
ncbi:uncharacterized protein LOC132637117 [Lycium barbarum]|uniref:uncharacterized protein LOC132637117 n=1 Tax=Lycium barbarum TaxID=112863 RepID=UPI00293E73F0|nr:uncharacterized protein LOC132637117 [Lycium barbarum]